METKIRSFKEIDASECIKIMEINKKDMGDLYTKDSLISASHHHPYFVAEENGQILGLVGFMDLGNGIGMLISLCVSPKAQGKGVGKLLVKKIKAYAKKNKFRKVLLLTHEKNKKMMGLAIKEDFVPEGSLKKHFRTGLDVMYFSYFA